MTTEEIRERLLKLGDEELKKIVEESSSDYTEEAHEIARKELQKRGVAFKKPPPPDPPAKRANESYPPLVGIILAYIGYGVILLGIVLPVLQAKKWGVGNTVRLAALALISGLMFLGFSEVIKQLHRIAENTRR